jgi:antitoxin HicB
MLEFVYPAECTRDRDGGYVVTFRDLPEVITQADTMALCVEEAAGALRAALEGRMMDGLAIPAPSRAKRGEFLASVPGQTSVRVALYLAMRQGGSNARRNRAAATHG